MTMPRPISPDQGPFAPLLRQIDGLLGVDDPAARHLGAGEVVGRLETTEFGQLVGGAFVRGFSGRLNVDSEGEGRGAIWFEAGRPIDVVLLDASPAEHAAATPALAERWFFVIGAWDAGVFTFQPAQASATPHRTHLLRHPAALVNETLLRRGDTPERLRRWLGSHDNCFELKRTPAVDQLLEAAVDDEPALRSAVHLFDGTRSIGAVLRASGHSEADVLRTAFVLFCFGALDFAPEPAAVAPPVPPPAGDEISGQAETRADRARLGALFALAQQADYFSFLGVDRAASRAEVASAARRMARELAEDNLHPDIALATGQERDVILAVLSEAARILGDDGLRARYRGALPKVPSSSQS